MTKLMHNMCTGVLVAVLVAVFPVSAWADYQAAPLATTKGPTFITEKSVRLNGLVNPNGMPDTKQWFEWGISGRSTVYETRHNNLSGSRQVNTSADLVGLAPKVQYFYRQVSENGRGKDVGQTVYFTTKELPVIINPLIIVRTEDATFVTEDKAKLSGYASPHGDGKAQWWFQWGTTLKVENETPHRTHGTDSSYYEENLKNLTPGTVYYFRTVGENSNGRVYGVTKAFVTLGTAPSLVPTSVSSEDVISEEKRDQNILSPDKVGDGQTRTVTTDGRTTATSPASVPLMSLTSTYRPGDFRSVTKVFTERGFDGKGPPGSAVTQSALAQASGPLATFWNNLTGKTTSEVIIEKIGPKKVEPHTTVEYRVSYAYRANTPATNGVLKIIIPETVVYIGDTTANELLLEENAGPERAYLLPLGRLEKGSTRTISLLGMTTGSAEGFPDVRARMEFVDQKGVTQVVAANNAKAGENSSALAGESGIGILPSSFLGWFVYILVVAMVIFSIRKAKAYYDARKKEIEEHDEEIQVKPMEELRFPGSRQSTLKTL